MFHDVPVKCSGRSRVLRVGVQLSVCWGSAFCVVQEHLNGQTLVAHLSVLWGS